MPLLINPETGERVHASHKGAEILRDEQGFVDAEPSTAIGGPLGIPQPTGIIVDNLREVDWNGANIRRIRSFLESGDRAYAEAVLAYEREHRQRDAVIELIGARLDELPESQAEHEPDGDALERPAKGASREDWDAYAESIDLDPSEFSSKQDLIDAVDGAEQEE